MVEGNAAVVVRLGGGDICRFRAALDLFGDGDDPAVALYTKLGVREDVMHFDIAPSGAP